MRKFHRKDKNTSSLLYLLRLIYILAVYYLFLSIFSNSREKERKEYKLLEVIALRDGRMSTSPKNAKEKISIPLMS